MEAADAEVGALRAVRGGGEGGGFVVVEDFEDQWDVVGVEEERGEVFEFKDVGDAEPF